MQDGQLDRATYRCFWEGGPLDPYRYACLASYGIHGHVVELYSDKHPLHLPGGVEPKHLTAVMQDSPLEHRLISSHGDTSSTGNWTPIDVLHLPPKSASTGEQNDSLEWIEAFQLWLPEYTSSLQKRTHNWQRVPLHLSFATMAGINLQCLPPPGSYLANLLNSNTKAESTLPSPVHDAAEVRLKIQCMLRENEAWALQPLQQLCNSKVLKDLGLNSKASFSHRLKLKIKGMLHNHNSADQSPRNTLND